MNQIRVLQEKIQEDVSLKVKFDPIILKISEFLKIQQDVTNIYEENLDESMKLFPYSQKKLAIQLKESFKMFD